MSVIRLFSLLAILSILFFALGSPIGCSTDDDSDDDDQCCSDDDDDSDSEYDCEDFCTAYYDECDLICYCDGVPLPEKDVCISTCEDHGGLPDCMAGCLDVYLQDADCLALEQCKLSCDQQA